MLGLSKRKIAKIISGVVIILALALGAFTTASPTSYAAPLPGTADDSTQAADTSGSDTSNEVSCAIDKIGWILCPLIEKAGVVGDQAFQLLSKNFLATEPELVARFNGRGGDSGTYMAWELARNIANLMFIAAFLIIILSQVTGRGLDNYGIKKLLPKLIIAALAVNLSYYICQLMVDLTNVMGYEIQNFLVQAAAQVTHNVVLPVNTGFTSTQTSNGTLGVTATYVLGAVGVVWFLLPVLFLGVSTVVITCLVIVAILLMRKAFIVLLVVASPIAFVMYLLPNTEKYFQKWMNMFWQLLLVFPTIALLFGGGQLASAIVLVAGSNGGTPDSSTQTPAGSYQDAYKDGENKCIALPTVDDNGKVMNPKAEVRTCGSSGTPLMLGLVAAGIAVAPLIAVWAVLKGALSAAGAIGGKIAGAIQTAGSGANKFARRPEDWARKAAFDTAKMGIATRALDSNNGIGRFVRRRQLGKDRRQSAFDAAKARFDSDENGGADLEHDIMRNKEFVSAAHIAGQRDYLKKVSGDSEFKNGAVTGKVSDTLKEALEAQEKRATDEVVKSIKEAFQSTDVKGKGGIQEAFDSALADAKAGKEGAMLRVKAMQDMLMNSGTAGRTAFRESYKAAGIAPGGATGDIDRTLRQNIQTNNAGAKEKDAALKSWADKGETSYTNAWENGSWGNVDSIEKFANLDGAAQMQAYNNMASSQRDQLRAGFVASPDAMKTMDLQVRKLWGL